MPLPPTVKAPLRAVASIGIAVGIILALWPLGQTAFAHWSQVRLNAEWNRQSSPASAGGLHPSVTKRMESHSDSATGARHPDVQAWPPTRIVIPDAKLDAVVVQGMEPADLRRGPGHERTSALPGQPGNCIISGHRNIYGSYFYRLDSLLPGSRITLRTPHASYLYQVVTAYTVPNTNLTPYNPIDPKVPQLTLVTCTLPHTIDRLVVTAQMAH